MLTEKEISGFLKTHKEMLNLDMFELVINHNIELHKAYEMVYDSERDALLFQGLLEEDYNKISENLQCTSCPCAGLCDGVSQSKDMPADSFDCCENIRLYFIINGGPDDYH